MNQNNTYEWSCQRAHLDILEALDLSNYFEQLSSRRDQNLSEATILIDLSKVKFTTLFGVLAFATVLSRCVCNNSAKFILDPPLDINAKGFMKHFGFKTLLDRASAANAVEFRSSLDGPEPKYGKRVFNSRPIYTLDDSVQFVDSMKIRSWINQLPVEIRSCDFFDQGRFARVICAELCENIANHAKLPSPIAEGRECFGVVGIRVIKQSKNSSIKWIQNTYNAEFKEFLNDNAEGGFVELCVCDAGQGIYKSLKNAYDKFCCSKGISDQYQLKNGEDSKIQNIVNVIQFAFDEIGSSKESHKQWLTDAHALSRILGLVKVYGGILEIISNNVRMLYRLDRQALLHADTWMGYKATMSQEMPSPFGTFVRILVPLMKTRYINEYSEQKKGVVRENYNYKFDNAFIVSMTSEFNEELLVDPEQFIKRSEKLGDILLKQKKERAILFDFTGAIHWKTDHIGTFVDQMTNIIRNRMVVIAGLNKDIAVELEKRVFDSVERVNRILKETDIGLTEDRIIEKQNLKYFLFCLVDSYRVILALDIEGIIYWLGASNMSIKVALTSILDEPGNLSEVCNRKKLYIENDCIPPSESDLISIARSCQHLLFEQYVIRQRENYFGWKLVLDRPTVDKLRGKTLSLHLNRHLKSLSKALWGNEKHPKMAFLLPHSNKWAEQYIESSRLLQEEEFAAEAGEVLARMVWFALGNNEPTALIASTASSILLANAVRQWFNNSPIIIDVGHYFDTAKRVAIKALHQADKIVIIQDIIDSGKTVSDLVNIINSESVKVAAVACLIEFQTALTDELQPGYSGERDFKGTDIKLPYVCLHRWRQPKKLVKEELAMVKTENRYWIEPYSLHPFKIESLYNIGDEYLLNNVSLAKGNHAEILQALEDNSAIAAGHFIFENHHFSIITRMRHLFESSKLCESIVDEIVSSCDGKTAELILIFPLHSNIRYLANKILDKLESKSIKPICLYPIVVRELGQRPFYIEPPRLAKLFREYVDKVQSGNKVKKYNIMIIDDTIASLRTMETILRTLYLCEGEALRDQKTLGLTCINKVGFWAIINRTGRAKSTLLYTFNRWFNRPFEFHCFAEYDVPVYDLHHCPICDENRLFDEIKRVIQRCTFSRLENWLDNRGQELKPIIVDTPKFEKLDTSKFPSRCNFTFNEHSCKTAELSMLVFLEKAERGCPASYLIKIFSEFSDKVLQLNYTHDQNIKKFRVFVFRWLLHNWKRLEADLSVLQFMKLLLQPELQYFNADLAPDILEAAGREYVNGVLSSRAFRIMLFYSLRHLKKKSEQFQREPSPAFNIARENIFAGILLCVANLISSEKDHELEVIINRILPDRAAKIGDFQGSIRRTLQTAMVILKPRGPSFIECLKIASMELLSPLLADPDVGMKHANRIIKRLNEIVNLESEKLLLMIQNGSLTKSSIYMVLNSIGFLETRSRALMEAIEMLFNKVSKPSTIEDKIKYIRARFDAIVSKLMKARDLMVDGQNIEHKSDLITSLWDDIRNDVKYLNDNLFSNEIYDEVRSHNVSYWEIIEKIRELSVDENVHARLVLPSIQDSNQLTVFADAIELQDLLRNHTIDVLKVHSNLLIKLEVNITSLDANEDQRIIIKIITKKDLYEQIYQKVNKGHSLRFERWGLEKYNAKLSLGKIENDTDGQHYNFEMTCSLLRGYA